LTRPRAWIAVRNRYCCNVVMTGQRAMEPRWPRPHAATAAERAGDAACGTRPRPCGAARPRGAAATGRGRRSCSRKPPRPRHPPARQAGLAAATQARVGNSRSASRGRASARAQGPAASGGCREPGRQRRGPHASV
jgi:hypothetical protein